MLNLLNGKYIVFLGASRIKEGARIECYESFANEKLYPKFYINEGVIIGYNFTALVSGKLSIGKNTIIASNVMITTHNHGSNPELDIPYSAQKLDVREVSVGSDCWIGEKVVILPGVEIGHHTIIGASSVVTKSCPPYSILVGSPAKVIKKYDFDLKKWVKV